jgi:hypothetical protein
LKLISEDTKSDTISVKQILAMLSKHHYYVLKYLIEFCVEMASVSNESGMGPKALSKIFGPSVTRLPPLEAYQAINKVKYLSDFLTSSAQLYV